MKQDSIIVPLSSLRPAQGRYCPQSVQEKKVLLDGTLYRGGSLLKVISVSDGSFYSLLDHHHHVLKALLEGATHAEVLVVEKWSEEQYHQELLKNKEVFSTDLTFYFWTVHGEWQDPFPSMDILLQYGELEPLRGFWARTKIYDFYEEGVLVSRRNAEGEALWIKSLGDLPPAIKKVPHFAELILCDVLRAHGIFEPPTIQKAREILKKPSILTFPHPPFSKWEHFTLDWLALVADK